MASKDYYNPQPNNLANPYHDYPDGRTARPGPSPFVTPFDDDRSYRSYSHNTPSLANSGVSGRRQDDSDPFEDDNAIPLSGRKPQHESTQTITPILPPDDPFVRDIDPRKQRRLRSGKGWFSGQITWVVFVLTFVQLVVFIAEIVKNAVLTKSPIEIHPSFNPMIGPSPYLLINMGARYPPCMHYIDAIQNSSTSITWPCPNATSLSGADVQCTLSDLCGFGGVPEPQINNGFSNTKVAPNQWWRFIVPIFLHAGIIHIGFNLLLQMTLGRDIEKLIGSVRFAIVYFAAGIFGFVLGGNFAAAGIASTGCSGSLFGILAISCVDIFYTWNERPSPWKDILFVVIDVAIAFVLGLLPGLDNFSHIGGFLMGLVLGISILRSPKSIAARRGQDPSSSHLVPGSELYPESSPFHITGPRTQPSQDLKSFAADPRAFFRDRRGIWWAWWLLRAATLLGVLIAFILLLKNFYVWENTCHWCKYLSCLDVTVGGTNWCEVGNLNFTQQPNTSSTGTGTAIGGGGHSGASRRSANLFAVL